MLSSSSSAAISATLTPSRDSRIKSTFSCSIPKRRLSRYSFDSSNCLYCSTSFFDFLGQKHKIRHVQLLCPLVQNRISLELLRETKWLECISQSLSAGSKASFDHFEE